MENYKKLLELLRSDPDCDTCGFEECNHNSCLLEVRSADAIESLLDKLKYAEGERDAVTKRMIEMEQEVGRLRKERDELKKELHDTKSELNAMRNELCCKCGKYREAHNGACDGCRWEKR